MNPHYLVEALLYAEMIEPKTHPHQLIIRIKMWPISNARRQTRIINLESLKKNFASPLISSIEIPLDSLKSPKKTESVTVKVTKIVAKFDC